MLLGGILNAGGRKVTFLAVSYVVSGNSNQGFTGNSEMNESSAKPGSHEIEEQLDHILRSKTFHLAQRSQAFLRYAVENSLRGNAPKEYAIAVDVLGRDEDLAVRLVEDHGVSVHPGYFFGFSGDGWLVVSLLTPEGDFRRGIEEICGLFAPSAEE